MGISVFNTNKRPEGFALPGGKKIVFKPGDNQISEDEFAVLMKPRGNRISAFRRLIEDKTLVTSEGTPTPREDKKAKANIYKQKRKRANELRGEIKKALKSKKRSMKYDDLAEDFIIDRNELKSVIAVEPGQEETSQTFLKWLYSEITRADK